MYNPYNNFMYPQIPQPQQQPMLLGEMVGSIESVKAARVDLTGAPLFFPLTDGSAIYRKQLMADGTAQLLRYEQVIENEIKTAENTNLSLTDGRIEELEGKINDMADVMLKVAEKIDGLTALWGGGESD